MCAVPEGKKGGRPPQLCPRVQGIKSTAARLKGLLGIILCSFISWERIIASNGHHRQYQSFHHHQTPTLPNMKWLSIALALAVPSEAYLRFGCGTVSIQRLDPIVEPGKVPSAHLHQIVGGNAFNATMDPTNGDISAKATCTTCSFTEDFSNYWTAHLFFKARNGSYKRVPLYPNALLGDNLNGGMTVYYLQQDFNSNKQKVTAFKPGFRMTVGSPSVSKNTHPGLRYTCLQSMSLIRNPTWCPC